MPRSQRTYDHRLVRLVQDTGDITIATGVGVPRSTATGWLRRATRDVTTVSTCETSSADLRARLARMEARLRRCQALLRVFLHPLESVTQVRRLVGFYVEQHNTHVPHSAFRGQTPDEMYFGTGATVPDQLAEQRATALRRRLAANRARRCAVCA